MQLYTTPVSNKTGSNTSDAKAARIHRKLVKHAVVSGISHLKKFFRSLIESGILFKFA